MHSVLTVMLTAIALKFVVADALPKVGYSTVVSTVPSMSMHINEQFHSMCVILSI